MPLHKDTSNNARDTFPSLKRFIEYKLEERKLKSVSGLSFSLSVLLSVFITVILVLNAILLVSIALMFRLDNIWGAPWGVVTVAGGLILVAVIFFLFRKTLFRRSFKKLLANTLKVQSQDIESDIKEATYYADIEQERISRPVRKVTRFLNNSRNLIGLAATTATVLGTITQFVRMFNKKSKV